jgi:hypothetical protein
LLQEPAKLVSRSRAAGDAQVARRLWEVSEQLTDTHFPLAETTAAASSK